MGSAGCQMKICDTHPTHAARDRPRMHATPHMVVALARISFGCPVAAAARREIGGKGIPPPTKTGVAHSALGLSVKCKTR